MKPSMLPSQTAVGSSALQSSRVLGALPPWYPGLLLTPSPPRSSCFAKGLPRADFFWSGQLPELGAERPLPTCIRAAAIHPCRPWAWMGTPGTGCMGHTSKPGRRNQPCSRNAQLQPKHAVPCKKAIMWKTAANEEVCLLHKEGMDKTDPMLE